MRIILLSFLSILIATTSAVIIPQITDYSLHPIVYTVIRMFAYWSDLNNIDTFKAIDVAVGIDGVYGIDIHNNVWNYSVLTGA
jgi:hypothetical protein